MENSMQTITRAIQILKTFSINQKELSLAQLHHELGLSKSSLQRILNTLVVNGFLEKDNEKKTYKLGLELYYLGKLVEENSHLLTTAKPYLQALRDKLGENVYINIIEDNERKCIAFEEAKHALMTISHIGQTSPLYMGASAKLLLAYLPQNEIEHYINQTILKPVTEKTIIDKDRLILELQDIREKGYAVSYGELVYGVFSASAPIFDNRNNVIAGIAVSAPLARVNDSIIESFITSVKEVANQISEELRF
ncbi:IclR family transcriptional regulator [Peribacillus glennii]|uniref:Glycerol operon regulatory protein n=1 Tax=Peribacillus glennii TaxID=2303991 RepID=A0A372LGM6_9BACI|nr:IclR family transcriptional regulator [Peribacillus glennii]RFU65134.1 IclR family transcriptional regulator [Peribacillus glennii]